MKTKIVSVIGLGYIGLPTAALLASNGHSVRGVDLSPDVVATVNQGKTHILEPDLDAFVRSAVTDGYLSASTLQQAADVYIICVPTPCREGEGALKPKLDYVFSATRSLASVVKSGDMIILESTSPVGTTEQMERVLRELGVNVNKIHMAYCPERVLPGKIMTELVENDRIVGGMTPAATVAVANFYRTFVRGEVFETSARTAELCKLTENSFRDVNIAFANELSLICDSEDVDVWDLIRLANRHPRVDILHPGPGVGGHCIAVDPWFIVSRNPKNARLIRTAREINNHKTDWVIDRIKIAVADALVVLNRPPKIVVFGIAFKPDVDDLRGSPALQIALTLQSQGHKIFVVEPNISSHKDLSLLEIEEGLDRADIIVFLVKHRQFVFSALNQKLLNRQALDFCGVLV